MKLTMQRCELEYPIPDNALQIIEKIGRVCYKSEDKITEDSAEKFIDKILNPDDPHESVIEHIVASMRFVTDRGVLAEFTRHRIASYSVESTRYCNYSKDKFGSELTFVLPFRFYDNVQLFADGNFIAHDLYTPVLLRWLNWISAMKDAEKRYLDAIDLGETPQEARDILPHSTKTEIVTTMNLREWRHFFKLRRSKRAHPQMQDLANRAYDILKSQLDVIF